MAYGFVFSSKKIIITNNWFNVFKINDLWTLMNFCESKFGAGNEVRTRDPDLGKVVLYQLSYSRLLRYFERSGEHYTKIFVSRNYFYYYFLSFQLSDSKTPNKNRRSTLNLSCCFSCLVIVECNIHACKP